MAKQHWSPEAVRGSARRWLRRSMPRAPMSPSWLVGHNSSEDAKQHIASHGSNGAGVEAYACDVTQADEIASTYERVVNDLGPVDILVNNAGKSEAHPFLSVTDEIWQGDLDLKLFAAVRLCRLAFPGMCQRRWGRVINILNTAAKTPSARSAPTSVSRAAGMALTKVLSNEGAPHNVLGQRTADRSH